MVGGRVGGKERGQGVSVWCLGQLNGVQRVEVMWEWCEFGGGACLCGWGGVCDSLLECYKSKQKIKNFIRHTFNHLRTSSQ